MLTDSFGALVNKHDSCCREVLLSAINAISSQLSLARAARNDNLAALFTDWFEARVRDAGVQDRYVGRLTEAALPMAAASCLLQCIARAAWAASEGDIRGMDAFLVGSVARLEACPVSDFDFYFLARDDAELAENDLPTGALIDTALENRRSGVLASSSWSRAFRRAAERAGYDMSRGGHHVSFALAIDELDRTRLVMPLGYETYATNYLASLWPLRQGGRWSLAQAQLLAGLTRNQALTKKMNLVGQYLGQLRAGVRPHSAHGIVSQMWQALLILTRGVPEATIPYWAVPLVVPLDTRAQRQWVLAITALSRYRFGEDRTIALYVVTRALLEVARCARSVGLDPSDLDEFERRLGV